MKPVFCFIDDAEFELKNFEENAAWAFERAEFIYAHSFEEAQAALRGRRPLGFLLDLYGSDPENVKAAIPDKKTLAARLPHGLDLDLLYEDAQTGDSEAGNRFLRRLYGQVQGWQQAFAYAAGCLGQSPQYGLNNLKQVRGHYPWAAALGYSRKALYADAALLSRAGLEAFMQKPQGAGDAEIALATRQAAPDLARAAYAAVERRLRAQAGILGLTLAQGHSTRELAALLHACLQGAAPPADLVSMLNQAQNLDPAARQLILALAEWLGAKKEPCHEQP